MIKMMSMVKIEGESVWVMSSKEEKMKTFPEAKKNKEKLFLSISCIIMSNRIEKFYIFSS